MPDRTPPSSLRRPTRVILLLLSAAVGITALAGCGADAPTTRDLNVMTRNMYLGAELTPLFGALSTADLAARATAVWQQVEASDVPGRVAAVAEEIVAGEPDVVGLQEVSLWQLDRSPDGPLTAADEVRYDVLDILTDALQERSQADGPTYSVVAVGENFEGEVPTTLGYDVRLTDRDVLLARTDLPEDGFTAEEYGNDTFDAALSVQAVPGTTTTIPRGWVAADVTLGGDRTVRVFNTHLEAIDGPEQVAQGAELSERAASADVPSIILGDINSRADGPPDTTTYADLIADGWVDAWVAAEPGNTCCQSPDLRNPDSSLTERIDVVLIDESLAARAATLTGDDPALRTPSGLWPSDHAGVMATVSVPAP